MIAKVCERRRDGLSSFAAGIAYIAAPGKASHLALHEVLSLNIAAAQMRFTSDACPRCRDPLYHLVISWPEGETPTDDEVEEAARHLLRRIGYHDHQWVLAVHRNTLTIHAHILICRVHPETGRAHYPHRDWGTLDHACREVELVQEWSHDRGRHVVVMTGDRLVIEDRPRAAATPPRLSDRALRYERATGRMSFQSWVATQPADIVRDATDWAEVHAAFQELGIAIRPKGSGHVIVDLADSTAAAKLSHMGLGGLAKIEARLGETYAPPDPTPAHRPPDEPRSAVDATPKQDQPFQPVKRRTRDAAQRDRRREEREDERLALHDLYRTSVADREERLRRERRASLEAQRASERDRRAALRADLSERRLALKGVHLSLVKRRAWTAMLAAVAAEDRAGLTATFQPERQALRDRFGVLRRTGWTDFLQERALAGDRAAQAALRGIRYRNRHADPATTTAPDPSPQPAQTDPTPPHEPIRGKPPRREPVLVRNGARFVEAVPQPPLETLPPSAPPLSRKARYKCAMLDEHYGQPIDRTIGELIHYVRLPRSPEEPLRVTLTSDEVLTDSGNLITVDSPGAVTDDAVAAFVTMVRAAEWPAVELFGSDDWIAAATKALNAAKIPNWPEGCRPELEPAAARRDEPSPHHPLPSPPMDMPEPTEPAPVIAETTETPSAAAWETPSWLGDEELESDPPQVGNTPSPLPPVSGQGLPTSTADPADVQKHDPIERLRDALLSAKRLPMQAADAALDAQLQRPAPPASRTQMQVEAWLAQAKQTQAIPKTETSHEHAVGPETETWTGAGDRRRPDRADGAADCRPDPASDNAARAGERRRRDPAAAGPDRRRADAARRGRGEAEHQPDRNPVASPGAGMTGPAAVAPEPRARPLPALGPKFQPPWIFSQYVKHLEQWRDHNLRHASAAAVIQSLPLVRKAVEDRGLALAATDGPELVDAFVVAILNRIDPDLLDAHAAVLALHQDRQITAAKNRPSSSDPPERTRSPSHPRGRDRDR